MSLPQKAQYRQLYRRLLTTFNKIYEVKPNNNLPKDAVIKEAHPAMPSVGLLLTSNSSYYSLNLKPRPSMVFIAFSST